MPLCWYNAMISASLSDVSTSWVFDSYIVNYVIGNQTWVNIKCHDILLNQHSTTHAQLTVLDDGAWSLHNVSDLCLERFWERLPQNLKPSA